MALIGTIRKNGWILIALMVLALGGFILMDVVSNSQRYQAGDVNTLGKVDGVTIKRSETEAYQELVYSNSQGSPLQVRDQVWKYFVEKSVVENEAEKIGLGVCKEELVDLQFGDNISPIIAERFRGDNGQPNRQQLANIKGAIEGGQFTDPKNRAYWATQEKEVVKKRLEDKIIALVSKGLYTPSWQAEMTFKENNERLDFKYVRIGLEKVTDEEAVVTDADYKTFLSQNPHLYDQTEETRLVQYVSFEVKATAADSADARTAVANLVEGLRTATSDSTYVASKGGNYDGSYKKKEALPVFAADNLMGAAIGTVTEPFLDGDVWTIAKVLDRKVTPDSVRARHILLKDDPQLPGSAEARIDSLMGLLKSGARFDSLAVKNSQDGSASKGGDLGFFGEGRMVPEFNNICFNVGEQGKFYKVTTQFGVHIIEITGKKFIKNETALKAVYLTKRIEPGKSTQQAAKDKAQALIQQSKSLEALLTNATQQNKEVVTSPALKSSDFAIGVLGSNDDCREIVRWAFDDKTKVGSVSPQIFAFNDEQGGFFDSRYVVTSLKSIAPKGAATVETLKGLPEAVAKVKSNKKAEVLKTKIQGTDLNAIAAQFQTKVDTARAATMLQGGGEPRMIGTAFSLAKDAVSAPIAGSSGVYVISPMTDKTTVQTPADLTLFRKQVTSTAVSNVRVGLLKSMIKAANTEDNRSRFY